MEADYISKLKYRGLISRIKRLSDSTIADGRKLYRYINIGIEPNWYLIFQILEEKGESTISEIAAILKFAHPSVISIIRKMERAGYVEINPSKYDKRKQLIQLSEKAKGQLPEMKKVWMACESAVESLFDNEGFLLALEEMESRLQSESFFDRVLNLLNNEEIRIADFKSEDSRPFFSLNEEWLNKYFSLEPIDKLVLNDPTRYIIEKGGHILMAHLRDATVGTVALLPKDAEEVELCRMAVNPRVHRMGIGAKLMEEAIHLARKNKYRSVCLYSNKRLKPAIKLYKKFGFIEEPLEDNVVYERANLRMKLTL